MYKKAFGVLYPGIPGFSRIKCFRRCIQDVTARVSKLKIAERLTGDDAWMLRLKQKPSAGVYSTNSDTITKACLRYYGDAIAHNCYLRITSRIRELDLKRGICAKPFGAEPVLIISGAAKMGNMS